MTLAFPKFRLLDLSVALSNNPHTDPPGLGPQIEYANHKQGLREMLRMFPGLKAEDLPDGEAWGVERLRVTAHNGTAHRCAVALRLDAGPRQAGHDDR